MSIYICALVCVPGETTENLMLRGPIRVAKEWVTAMLSWISGRFLGGARQAVVWGMCKLRHTSSAVGL